MSEKMCIVHSKKVTNIVIADCKVEDRRTGEVSVAQFDFEMWGARFSETDFNKVSVRGSEIENLERISWYKYMIGRIANKYGFDLVKIVRLNFERHNFSYEFRIL